MLLEIRKLLQDRGRVSLMDLSLHFGRDTEAMRGMVAHWVGKGVVRQIDPEACACAGCGKCAAALGAEVYEWIGPAPKDRPA